MQVVHEHADYYSTRSSTAVLISKQAQWILKYVKKHIHMRCTYNSISYNSKLLYSIIAVKGLINQFLSYVFMLYAVLFIYY